MPGKTKQEELSELRQEVAALRSFVIGMAGKDPEGEYNPEFVQSIYEASKEEPQYIFEDGESFLDILK